MSKEKLIDLDQEQLGLLEAILKRHIPDKTVWAYGSRVTWKAGETSDLDLAIFGCDSMEIYDLKEALEESDLLISVDVVDWENIPEKFKENIRKKYVILQKKRELGGWREVKLGDVVCFQRGHDLSKSKMELGDIPVAGSNGIIGYHNIATTRAPGLTIGRSGNIGTPKLYKIDFWAHNTTLYSKDFFGNDEVFIFYLLQTLDLSGFNSGSAVPTLNRNYIHELNIKLPPLPEQKAIAEVLSSLDDKIDLLHRQNQTLEDMAQALFREWFVIGVDERWEKKSLSHFGVVICGKTPSKKNHKYFGGKIPFIKIPDMHGKTFVFDVTDTLTEKGKNSQGNKTLPPKSICVSCIATVGLVSMNAFESQTNQQINSIIPEKDEYRYYIYLFYEIIKEFVGSNGKWRYCNHEFKYWKLCQNYGSDCE